MKSGFYKTISDDQFSSWTKKFQSTSESQTSTTHTHTHTHIHKKVMIPVWWFADNLIHYSFLNPSETITSEKYAQQIDEMHWKLQHPPLVLINRTGLILLHDTTRPHATQPTGWSFASPATFTWLPANRLPHRQASWQLFTGKMLP